MEKIKNIVKLASNHPDGTTFQPLTSIPASAKIRSILEVIVKNDHLCSLNEDGTCLAVLEYQTDTLVRSTLPGGVEQKKNDQPADKRITSSQSQEIDKAQLNSGAGRKGTVIFILDLQSGRCSCLGSIEGSCSVAVFHPEAPLLAVLQPPHRVFIFHVERKCCCEVIEFSNVAHTLLGLQWLPRPLGSARQPGASCGGVSLDDGGVGSSSGVTSGLLGFSQRELVTFRSPGPCERSTVQPSVYWAGAVQAGAVMTVVREDGSVELLSTTGDGALPLPSGAAQHLPVVAVLPLLCDKILLVVLRGWCVVRCDVQERTTSLITLEAPASPAALLSAVTLNTRHPLYSQVVLLLDSVGAVHVLCAHSWTCLRTVQSPSLAVKSMTASSSGELLCLTYSNRTSKLYRLSSLLPLPSGSVLTKPSSGKENRPGTDIPRPGDTAANTGASGGRSEAHRVRFSEVRENAPASAGMTCTKSSLNKVKRAASHPDWRKLLDEFGSFPSGERAAIWCGLLGLPRCAAIHDTLAGKVLHAAVPPYASMADRPLRDTFRRTLSCLYYWAPQLSAVPWVPSFVFPFVKSLQHAPLVCFELCVTLLVSWCRLWFSPAPDALVPPVLNTVEVIVCDASPRLMAALVHARVTAQTYAWPLLSTAFAQVLSAEDWAVAWDHLLCRPPSFLLCFAAAYTLCLSPAIRAALADQPQHIESLYRQEAYLPVRSVLKRAAELHASLKLDAALLQRLDVVAPFPEGGLPLFHNVPDVQAVDQSSAAAGEGAIHSLGWTLDEAELERERAVLREREDSCIAAIKRIRRQHLGLS